MRRKKRTGIMIAGLTLALALALAGPAFAGEKAPGKPTLTSVTSTSVKKMTVTWKPVKKADGYQVWYGTGDTAKKKTVKGGTEKTLTLKDLTGGAKYTVKVRSYRNVEKQGTTEKLTSAWSGEKTVTIKKSKWSDLQDKYRTKDEVKDLIFVKYKGGTRADLVLYEKTEDKTWKKVLDCDAYVGQNGINKEKEGDRKTPKGVYTLTHAFGIKEDPGAKMDYIKVNKNHYWCGDKNYYNQFVDIKEKPHKCSGEHLIDYTKQYAYAMAMNYNPDNTYKKGSAIFLHCFGYNTYTLGCVAVSQDNMKTILKTCQDNTRICIYKK